MGIRDGPVLVPWRPFQWNAAGRSLLNAPALTGSDPESGLGRGWWALRGSRPHGCQVVVASFRPSGKSHLVRKSRCLRRGTEVRSILPTNVVSPRRWRVCSHSANGATALALRGTGSSSTTVAFRADCWTCANTASRCTCSLEVCSGEARLPSVASRSVFS